MSFSRKSTGKIGQIVFFFVFVVFFPKINWEDFKRQNNNHLFQ